LSFCAGADRAAYPHLPKLMVQKTRDADDTAVFSGIKILNNVNYID
jgi:hypothetical protein